MLRVPSHSSRKSDEPSKAHQRPDDVGLRAILLSDGILALGHRRLADYRSVPGGAPTDEGPDNDNWITFNGEIYNFQDLRRSSRDVGVCVPDTDRHGGYS